MVAITLPIGLEGELTVLVNIVSDLSRTRKTISREGAKNGEKRALYLA